MTDLRPYRGLARYRYIDAPLFAGRDVEIDSCIQKLQGGETLFILHGNSGCGKSSFLEAGLIPRLEAARRSNASRLEPLHGVADSADSPFVIRLGHHPLRAIGRGLFMACQQVDSSLIANRSLATFLSYGSDDLFDVLGDLTLKLAPHRKMLLVLDQAESVFSDVGERSGELREYFDLLGQVTCAGLFVKIVVSLRTDFKGRFDDHLLKSQADHTQILTHYLDEIAKEGILQSIMHPTQLPDYRLSFEPGVPQTIVEDLESIRGVWPLLPVLQVICDRLATHVRLAGRDEITEKDYRSTGASSAQIASHVEESIVNFFIDRRLATEVDIVGQADRWQRVLASLVNVDVDGRTRARLSVPQSDIVSLARGSGCVSVTEMLDWLSMESQYILENVEMENQDVSEGHAWKLMHDSIAVALRPWLTQRSSLSAGSGSVRQVPGPEDLDLVDLYGQSQPETVEFTTINDLIWDHQIPLYAKYRNFSGRLGLEFKVGRQFDLTMYSKETNYYTKLFELAKQPSVRLLAVLPGSVFPQILDSPWVTVGIPNIYRGYAVVGRKQAGLTPVRSRGVDADLIDSAGWARLERLGATLALPSTKIQSYEKEGTQFVNCILRLAGQTPRTDIRVVTSEYGGRFQGTQDPMFTSLMAGTFDFVLGPAPSRALAEQAGFEVFADFDDIYSLSCADHNDPVICSAQRTVLDSLLLHENWVVNIPLSDTDPLLMRMAAVLFYTVNYIRENPDDFVRFLSNQVYASRERGAYPLQREFIKRTVSSCYEYIAPTEHPFTFFSPSSRYRFPGRSSYAPSTVYGAWAGWRAKCDRLLMRMIDEWPGDWPETAREAFRRAEYHCNIFNYFDAYEFLMRAQSSLELAAGMRGERRN
jgi:hypothetical protein